MLKALVSRGHPEFSSNRQQDAHEFFLHIINLVEVSEANYLLFILVTAFCFNFGAFNPLFTCFIFKMDALCLTHEAHRRVRGGGCF